MIAKLERHNDQYGNPESDYTLTVLFDERLVVDVAQGDLEFLKDWLTEKYWEVDFPTNV